MSEQRCTVNSGGIRCPRCRRMEFPESESRLREAWKCKHCGCLASVEVKVDEYFECHRCGKEHSVDAKYQRYDDDGQEIPRWCDHCQHAAYLIKDVYFLAHPVTGPSEEGPKS